VLIVSILAIPFTAAIIMLLLRRGSPAVPVSVSAIVFVSSCLLLRGVFSGNDAVLRVSLPGPYVPTFRADAASSVFAALAAFVWLAVSIYMPGYMKHEKRPESFYIWTLFTQTAVLGVFLAGDFLTMLLFFELMTVASYFWVIDRWDRKAVRAGYLYLFFSLAAGFLVAMGIVMTSEATGILPAVGSGPAASSDPRLFGWGIAMFALGFGIKAGIVPLHVWLPHAHSAAPTPASALLSGLLIKVGAYGLVRTAGMAGWGLADISGVEWFGPTLTAAGICSMLIGVVSALLQSDAKRLLAYHSISQMGYIAFGLGIGSCLGADGGVAVAGAVYHVMNHALFKAALFLGVGIIYVSTHETNLYRLGGLLRRFPVTAALMLVAVLGITGAPGLNGYASKTLLHHAAGIAAETGSRWLAWAERLFVVTGVGTAASFIKLYYLIFLRKPGEEAHRGKRADKSPADAREQSDMPAKGRAPAWMHAAMGLLAAAMVGIGVAPGFFAEKLVIPVVRTLGAEQGIAGLAAFALPDHVGSAFWNAGDVFSIIITLIVGMLVCIAGLRLGIFHWKPPVWMTEEGLGKMAAKGVLRLWDEGAREYHVIADNAHESGDALKNRLYSFVRKFDRARSGTVGRVTVTGISADAALLFVILALLIVWYIIVHPDIPESWLWIFRTQQ
jgi:formate hydrogenlyase subunit 3/multisubunit Na+/H+ antiporter MnhD subunit